jgi:hypothetical protein
MSLPQVVVYREDGGEQRVHKVLIDLQEIRVSEIELVRSVNDVTRVRLTIPCEYFEETA